MRQAVALGLRLAWLGRGAARLRTLLVALASLVGCAVLLAVAGLVTRDLAVNPWRYSDRAVIWLGMAVVMGVAVPVLVLAATVGRLSSGLRAQRLASLRLLGLGPGRTRVVAMTETAVAALAGSAAGAVLIAVTGPLLALVPLPGQARLGVGAPLWLVAAVVVLVPLVVALVASLPERLGRDRVLSGVRRAESRRPSAWRLLPLVGGIGWCGYFGWDARTTIEDTGWLGFNLIGSITLLGIGVLAVVPVVVRLVGELLLVLGRSPASRLAARRIQAQPATMTRVVSGLLIGLFVVTGARCVVVAFESTPQYVGAEYGVEVQQWATLNVRPGEVGRLSARLETIPGYRGTVVLPTVQSRGDCAVGWCLRAAVASCADVERLAPGVRGCRDDVPMWVGSALEEPQGWVTAEGGTAMLPSPVVSLRDGDLPAWQAIDAEVVIPPGLAARAGLRQGRSLVAVLADPGRDLDDSLAGAGVGSYSGWSVTDYDYVATLRAMVWAIGALVISLGLLSFGIAAVDRAVERRREVVTLQVVGVPAGVLRRAQWIEVAAPLVSGSVLAVAAGLSAGSTYLTLDDSARLPWSATLLLCLLGVVGGTLVAGLTVIAASPRIRPELMRAE